VVASKTKSGDRKGITKLKVKVQRDHLQKIAGLRGSTEALAELVWNSLDADARHVRVLASRTGLDGIDSVTVADDGHGMTRDEALIFFENLGNSWKKGRRSRGGRELHGQAGQGRFCAFALGSKVEWVSRYRVGDQVLEFRIAGDASALEFFGVGEAQPSLATELGTIVTVSNITETAEPTLAGKIDEKLLRLFAPYLKRHPDVRLSVNGIELDSEKLITHTAERMLPHLADSNGKPMNASFTVIEWAKPVERQIILCDSQGVSLATRETSVRPKGFQFTAYVRSDRIRELHADNFLESHDLHADVRALLDATQAGLRDYFRERSAVDARSLVEQWKEEQVYPFDAAPATLIEEAEQQMFDVVAVNLHEYLPAFSQSDAKTKRVSFRLLRSAIEQSPEQIRRIIEEVLDLSPAKRDELVDLIEKTSLEAVIGASKKVVDRLEFLKGLEVLLFDAEAKKLTKERQHLHRILSRNAWIFGEEYSISVDDQSLNEVLKRHLHLLRKPELGKETVTAEDGKTGIVDLMLSRSIPLHRGDEYEHLVVELKRPAQKLNSDVITQIKQYAFAVITDERFANTKTRWVFWALSNEMNEFAHEEVNQTGRDPGVCYQKGNVIIYLKTWSEVLAACRARMAFFQKELGIMATHEEGLEHLRKFYKEHIPDLSRKSAQSAVSGTNDGAAAPTAVSSR